ncbi:hypothetical protein LOC71_22945 [Rhodopirellula sp. JC740]|uniref:Secreted protein n=1 Tax=Rhodopirellula halodulae TaxID=2894198 RepID=A0ABS8NNI4_9BACT|nr:MULTISPECIES: hypothetical protein [unclassified Rhodopirellula]MCC9645147.1 hypothetical protein [Rhodopirellula sp. JC740]MCC9658659.1 hypothetical protein [Rhodopirellula sp. JC737]
MKHICKLALLALLFPAVIGCGGSEPANVAGGASESEIEEYNRMLQESQSQMAEADEAMAKQAKGGR